MVYVSREGITCCQTPTDKRLLSDTGPGIKVISREPGLPVGKVYGMTHIGIAQADRAVPSTLLTGHRTSVYSMAAARSSHGTFAPDAKRAVSGGRQADKRVYATFLATRPKAFEEAAIRMLLAQLRRVEDAAALVKSQAPPGWGLHIVHLGHGGMLPEIAAAKAQGANPEVQVVSSCHARRMLRRFSRVE